MAHVDYDLDVCKGCTDYLYRLRLMTEVIVENEEV